MNNNTFELLETKRQQLQLQLDKQKSKSQRNRLGQFPTPKSLALQIAEQSLLYLDTTQIRFLDPAFGTGAFYSALNLAISNQQVTQATGFEIDQFYGLPAKELWQTTRLDYQIADFSKAEPTDSKYNLLICNPPYVRHHHISQDKKALQRQALTKANMQLSGLAGLYCYFIALCHTWMAENAIAAWLIPSEFMDVKYGKGVKDYLLNQVTLLHIHRFNPADNQFDDALVSSVIVWFKNTKPQKHNQLRLTFGADLTAPTITKQISNKTLSQSAKWTQLFTNINHDRAKAKQTTTTIGDFFTIKRGIATGNNRYFVLSKTQIDQLGLPLSQCRPILPSPRYLKLFEINANTDGSPEIDKQLFVLDSQLAFKQIKNQYPKLYDYLQQGIDEGVADGYLCRHRKIWYAQENRPSSYFYCTYIGRQSTNKTTQENHKPFRFLLNWSDAIVANTYLILYPKPELAQRLINNPDLIKQIHQSLLAIPTDELLSQARVYGGGMYKLEPKELTAVNIELEIQHS